MPVVISGTAGITNNATDLNYTGTLTGGTGVVNFGSGQFYKDASGNVGIGTSSPSTNLHVYGSTNSQIRLQNASNSHYVGNISGSMEIQSADIIKFLTSGANERARIDSNGTLMVATTSNSDSAIKFMVGSILDVRPGTNVRIMSSQSNQFSTTATASTNNTLIEFGRSATTTGNYTACGKLWLDGSGNFAAANASDVRLKENIVDLPDGLKTILALKPRQFDWIGDVARKAVKGFVAQEVEEVLPRSVGVDETTGMKLISMDSELFPLLVASIQELKAELDSVKAELATLKGAQA